MGVVGTVGSEVAVGGWRCSVVVFAVFAVFAAGAGRKVDECMSGFWCGSTSREKGVEVEGVHEP